MNHVGYLRKAERQDVNLLFFWANDKDVRKTSFSTELIPYEEHVKWFQEKLCSKDCDIYIYMIDTTPIGQIRLDYVDKSAIISYSIQKEYRGRGYGGNLLQMVEKKLILKEGGTIEQLIGRVKYENLASQKKFEEMKYQKYLKKEFIEYIKYIKN